MKHLIDMFRISPNISQPTGKVSDFTFSYYYNLPKFIKY